MGGFCYFGQSHAGDCSLVFPSLDAKLSYANWCIHRTDVTGWYQSPHLTLGREDKHVSRESNGSSDVLVFAWWDWSC